MNQQTKQTLMGPLVVGMLFGVLAGSASFGFDMEYGASIHPTWQPLWLYAAVVAVAVCTAVAGGSVLLLGLLPVLVRRAWKS